MNRVASATFANCPSPPAPLPKQVWGEGCQACKKDVNDEGGKGMAYSS